MNWLHLTQVPVSRNQNPLSFACIFFSWFLWYLIKLIRLRRLCETKVFHFRLEIAKWHQKLTCNATAHVTDFPSPTLLAKFLVNDKLWKDPMSVRHDEWNRRSLTGLHRTSHVPNYWVTSTYERSARSTWHIFTMVFRQSMKPINSTYRTCTFFKILNRLDFAFNLQGFNLLWESAFRLHLRSYFLCR